MPPLAADTQTGVEGGGQREEFDPVSFFVTVGIAYLDFLEDQEVSLCFFLGLVHLRLIPRCSIYRMHPFADCYLCWFFRRIKLPHKAERVPSC